MILHSKEKPSVNWVSAKRPNHAFSQAPLAPWTPVLRSYMWAVILY